MSLGQRHCIAVAASVALVVLAGCGGGDDSSGGTKKTAAQRDIQPEAQQRAEGVLLQLSDLPTGWRGSRSEDSGGDHKFRECVGANFSNLTINGEADSQDFAMGENSEVSSTATVFATDQDAQTAFADFARGMTGRAAPDCFTTLVTAALQKDDSSDQYKIGDVAVGELNFTHPTGVEESRAFQVEVPVEAQGISVSAFLEFAVLRQGDALATVVTQDVSSPFDSGTRDELVQTVADRMSGDPTATPPSTTSTTQGADL